MSKNRNHDNNKYLPAYLVLVRIHRVSSAAKISCGEWLGEGFMNHLVQRAWVCLKELHNPCTPCPGRTCYIKIAEAIHIASHPAIDLVELPWCKRRGKLCSIELCRALTLRYCNEKAKASSNRHIDEVRSTWQSSVLW